METIYDRHGEPLHTSKNLAGIRRYVSNNIVSVIELIPLGKSGALLSMHFDDGAFYTTQFASYSVLLDFVRKWRNVYGAALIVDGLQAGKVESKNPYLM